MLRLRCRRLIAILLIASAAISGGTAAGFQQRLPAPAFAARVVRVLDGDTIEVRSGRTIRIRLEGVDCPEAGQPFGSVARNFTRRVAFDRIVTVRPVTTDRYGRVVARVIVDSRDLSVELVRAGLAWHYTTYSSDPNLALAEKTARGMRAGLWADPNPTPPWVARRPSHVSRPQRGAPVNAVAGPVHANTRSRVFHLPGCPNYNCRNCTAVFESAAHAVAAGYKPAGDCARR